MYLIYLLEYNVGIMYYVGTRYIQNSRLLIIISESFKKGNLHLLYGYTNVQNTK